MLGLLLLYFIWKQFADLAVKYDKSKWGFGILGIVIYYAGTFFAGIILALVTPNLVTTSSDIELSLMAIPFGIVSCVILYLILKRIWEKNYVKIDDEIETIGQDLVETNTDEESIAK